MVPSAALALLVCGDARSFQAESFDVWHPADAHHHDVGFEAQLLVFRSTGNDNGRVSSLEGLGAVAQVELDTELFELAHESFCDLRVETR